MAIIQAILALISRSLGSILSALFGWAVVALFGQTSSREKVWLSALVGAAAGWPLLLLGVFWPRLAALILTFVPLPAWVPTSVIRTIWIALTLAVPLIVGGTLAARARGAPAPIPGTMPPGDIRRTRTAAVKDSPVKSSKAPRLLQGIPITLAIAASFGIVFVTTPVRRLLAMARRHINIQIPLITDAQGYEFVAIQVARTLARHGFEVQPAEPGWWMTAPLTILARFGGPSFRDYVPDRLARFRGPRLDVLLLPNGLSLRGSEQDTAWAHGLLLEALTDAPAYQTFDPAAQDVERQIRSVWAVVRQDPRAHEGASALEARLHEIACEIRELPVGYEEWQIVYRQALQLGRVLRGEPQLLGATVAEDASETDESTREVAMRATGQQDTVSLSLGELISGITEKITLLAKKEAELAAIEVKADVGSELSMAKGLAIAVILGILGLNVLLVALVLALATLMPAWLAAVLIGAALLVMGGIVGYVSWARRVTRPLTLTRKTLKENAQWAKERLA